MLSLGGNCLNVAETTFSGDFVSQHNNNNSYIALYPVKIDKLAALHIIDIKIRLTTNNNKNNNKGSINAYINIKMTTTTKKPG